MGTAVAAEVKTGQLVVPIKKDGEIISFHFKAVEVGTMHKCEDNTEIPIEGFLVSDDRKTVIPCLRMQSDYSWQLNCLIDRLFHPDKYRNPPMNEDVEKEIEYLTEWVMEHTEEAYRYQIPELVAQIIATPEKLKAAAEKRIKAHIKEMGV